ncbi:unnamed protein product [Hymenolepis diminuta]|uniref:Uncharacterized protein n=1 Tax=Hymenolepis diminuta TaxID=6216 RepID=A0A564Z8X0_HYMDI|nr:unnamed protein product [Hymenolepis diminuta]
MISPAFVGYFPKSSDILQRDFERLRNELRPEVIDIKKENNKIVILLPALSSKAIPRIQAFYADGMVEPEVFLNNSDYSSYNSLDYRDILAECNDILISSIKGEFRKDLLKFLQIPKISNSILSFLLKRTEGSSLKVLDNQVGVSLFKHFRLLCTTIRKK